MSVDIQPALILDAATRLGAVRSEGEIDLWRNSRVPQVLKKPITHANIQLAHEQVWVPTLVKMRQSDNPYFRNAEESLLGATRNSRAQVIWMDSLQSNSMWVETNANSDVALFINPEYIINEAAPISIASMTVHEVLHLKTVINYIDGLSPSLNSAQKKQKIDYYMGKRRHSGEEEAGAYGEEARAFIFQCGLLGEIYRVPGSDQFDRAVEFVKMNMDHNSKTWKRYISEIRP